MKIPFDIKYRPEIESGKYKVKTRYGKSARIVCWDRKDKDKPILALITDSEGHEFNNYYTVHGWQDTKEKYPDKYDLFITDDEELTEFEKALSDSIDYWIHEELKEPTVESVKGLAQSLLGIAKKELEKDLPKWKNITNDRDFYLHESLEDYIIKDILHPSGEVKERLVLKKTDLEKLPKKE